MSDVCRTFLEYIIAEKARDARIPWDRLEWEEEDHAPTGTGRVLSLTVHTGGCAYREHFPEDEVQRYMSDPEAFASVESRMSYLLSRALRGTRAR